MTISYKFSPNCIFQQKKADFLRFPRHHCFQDKPTGRWPRQWRPKTQDREEAGQGQDAKAVPFGDHHEVPHEKRHPRAWEPHGHAGLEACHAQPGCPCHNGHRAPAAGFKSLRAANAGLNGREAIDGIFASLGLGPRDELPHGDTINCLMGKCNPDGLETAVQSLCRTLLPTRPLREGRIRGKQHQVVLAASRQPARVSHAGGNARNASRACTTRARRTSGPGASTSSWRQKRPRQAASPPASAASGPETGPATRTALTRRSRTAS
jgi:hypothetical protein